MKSRLVTLVLMFAISSAAEAHGINGHINVTDWAALTHPIPGAWQEAECRNAMVFGSSFPQLLLLFPLRLFSAGPGSSSNGQAIGKSAGSGASLVDCIFEHRWGAEHVRPRHQRK